jgi:hypothetical protein
MKRLAGKREEMLKKEKKNGCMVAVSRQSL